MHMKLSTALILCGLIFVSFFVSANFRQLFGNKPESQFRETTKYLRLYLQGQKRTSRIYKKWETLYCEKRCREGYCSVVGMDGEDGYSCRVKPTNDK